MQAASGPRLSPTERLERVIANYEIKSGRIDPSVENMRFSRMIAVYRDMTRHAAGVPPTQECFSWVIAGALGNTSEAVLARANRAYISLVAQHHSFTQLSERFFPVCWDDWLDLHYGIDLLVHTGSGISVALALNGDTQRGEREARRKRARLEKMDLPLLALQVRRGEYTVGPFWLYEPAKLVTAVCEAAADAEHRLTDPVYALGYEHGRTSMADDHAD